ncbi:class I SAM-dependent methyltransferase [Microlunatus soli]|uniref:Methyltransferase domain-containing protein n=1 Tax=Microlunatus soli TaxID=630515 RepID=A0A1H1VEC6_9ACTN|nr:class I SAM-dependent methyltransferase [Microlunatus soli]SDS82980.1 Methyltransferase domain-containing protein [Microlunatus soli]
MAPEHLSEADRQQRGYWDDHADSYDRSMGFIERRVLRDSRGWACGQAEGRTLEVAIGTGLNLPWYPAGVDLVGVELSPRMLQVARQRATALGLSVDLREGTADALDLADNSFDTVICTIALCAIPDDQRAVQEMIRVLRPGGKLILVDHVSSSHGGLRFLQRTLELWSIRHAGEHFTRRPIKHLYAAGLHIDHQDRYLAGIIERVVASKPNW